jgi:hypothetical protein
MRRLTICLFILIGALTTIDTSAQPQRDKNKEKAIKIIRRSDQITNEVFSSWYKALRAECAVCPVKNVNENALLAFTSHLWKDDEFQKDVSDKLLQRVPQLPKTAYDEWVAALAKYSGETLADNEPVRVYALLLLIQQDRLFDGDKFNSEGSKVLLKRLSSVPKKSIAKWFEATDPMRMGGESETALSIIEQDLFFQTDVFQDGPFTQRLNEVLATKNKK